MEKWQKSALKVIAVVSQGGKEAVFMADSLAYCLNAKIA